MIKIDAEKCDLCGTCLGVCPENVMTLTLHALIIDQEGCTNCSKCVWVCPVRALELVLDRKSNRAEVA